MLRGPDPGRNGVSTWRAKDLCRIVEHRFGVSYSEKRHAPARVAELDTERAPYLLGTRVTYLTMNVRPELSDATPNPLSDVKVRQALNYAIDKDAIIQDRPWQYSGTSGAPRKPSPQA